MQDHWTDQEDDNGHPDGDHIHIPLESRIHRPKYIIHIKAVHIFIYQKYIFQLTKGGKMQEVQPDAVFPHHFEKAF